MVLGNLRVTVLVENSAGDSGLSAEHGLSFWVEAGDKRILFDAGQSEIVVDNAKLLGIDLAEADAVVLSHGHYDHTGGLSRVLEMAKRAKVYMHPAAVEPKFSRRVGGVKYNGMCESAIEAIRGREVILSEGPTEICEGVVVTGRVPRVNDFEGVGGAFFRDEMCIERDLIDDDQTLFVEMERGVVIVFGCCHSGVVNTLNYISNLTGRDDFYAAMGGMHLLHSSDERIEKSMLAFKKYGLEKVFPAHCTGEKAVAKFKETFKERCLECSAGSKIEF